MSVATASIAIKPIERPWKLAFGVTILSTLVISVGYLGYSPLLPGIQKDLAMNFTQLGLFTGMAGPMGLIFSLPIGMVIRRYGAKLAVAVSLAGAALGLGLLADASDFGVALAGRAIWMAGFTIAATATTAAVAIVVPHRIMAFVMSLSLCMINVGAVIGAPLGAILGTGYGWRAGITAFAGLALVMLVLFSAFFRAPHPEPAAPEGTAAETAKTSSAFKSPMAWAVAALLGLATLVTNAFIGLVPVVLVERLKLSAIDVGSVFLVGFAIGIPVVLLAGVLATRLDTRKWVLFAVTALIAILSLLLNVQDTTLFMAAVVAILALACCPAALVHAMPPYLFPHSEMGPAMSVISLASSVGAYIGPQMTGILRDATGAYSAGWYFMAAMSAVLLLALASLNKIK